MRHWFFVLTGLLVSVETVSGAGATNPEFEQGRDDHQAVEKRCDGVSGDFRAGADYWAATEVNRPRLPAPLPAVRPISSRNVGGQATVRSDRCEPQGRARLFCRLEFEPCANAHTKSFSVPLTCAVRRVASRIRSAFGGDEDLCNRRHPPLVMAGIFGVGLVQYWLWFNLSRCWTSTQVTVIVGGSGQSAAPGPRGRVGLVSGEQMSSLLVSCCANRPSERRRRSARRRETPMRPDRPDRPRTGRDVGRSRRTRRR